MKIIEYVFAKQDLEFQVHQDDSWQFRAGFLYPVIQEEDSSELQVYFHLLQSDESLHQRVLVLESAEWHDWVASEPNIHQIPAADLKHFMEQY